MTPEQFAKMWNDNSSAKRAGLVSIEDGIKAFALEKNESVEKVRGDVFKMCKSGKLTIYDRYGRAIKWSALMYESLDESSEKNMVAYPHFYIEPHN